MATPIALPLLAQLQKMAIEATRLNLKNAQDPTERLLLADQLRKLHVLPHPQS
jgi:hypothetical protein